MIGKSIHSTQRENRINQGDVVAISMNLTPTSSCRRHFAINQVELIVAKRADLNEIKSIDSFVVQG